MIVVISSVMRLFDPAGARTSCRRPTIAMGHRYELILANSRARMQRWRAGNEAPCGEWHRYARQLPNCARWLMSRVRLTAFDERREEGAAEIGVLDQLREFRQLTLFLVAERAERADDFRGHRSYSPTSCRWGQSDAQFAPDCRGTTKNVGAIAASDGHTRGITPSVWPEGA